MIYTAVLASGLVLMAAVYPLVRRSAQESSVKNIALLVGNLGLTDLCLFTEARYTRHLSQAGLFSAFQNAPMAFEHYPSGAMTRPPEGMYRRPGTDGGR